MVDLDVRLYSYTQGKEQSNNSYMEGFRSLMNTVNAYDGRAGFHPGMFQRYMGEYLKEKGYGIELDVANTAELKAMQEKARATSCEEYLAYLYFLLRGQKQFLCCVIFHHGGRTLPLELPSS